MIEVNHSKIKETNRNKIIKLLLEENEITKLDISRNLGISITTVSTNISELNISGLDDIRNIKDIDLDHFEFNKYISFDNIAQYLKLLDKVDIKELGLEYLGSDLLIPPLYICSDIND